MERVGKIMAAARAAKEERTKRRDRLTAELKRAETAIQQALDSGSERGYFEACRAKRKAEKELKEPYSGSVPTLDDLEKSLLADKEDLKKELEKAAEELVKVREKYKACCDRISKCVSAFETLNISYRSVLDDYDYPMNSLPQVYAPTPAWGNIRNIPGKYGAGFWGIISRVPDTIQKPEDVFLK